MNNLGLRRFWLQLCDQRQGVPQIYLLATAITVSLVLMAFMMGVGTIALGLLFLISLLILIYITCGKRLFYR